MDTLTKSVPRLDPDRVADSFQKIQDYLCSMMEQIDYTLSRHGVVLGEANLEETVQQIGQLKGLISALSSNLSALNSAMGALSIRVSDTEGNAEDLLGRMSAVEQTINTLTSQIGGLDTRLTAAEGDILDLVARVTALEG